MAKNMIARIASLSLLFITVMLLIACIHTSSTSGHDQNANTIALLDCSEIFHTSYGSLDYTTAEQGYVIFTASDDGYTLIIQDPQNTKNVLDVQKEIPVTVPLTGDDGRYLFAVSAKTTDGDQYQILYKNSFNTTIHSGLDY